MRVRLDAPRVAQTGSVVSFSLQIENDTALPVELNLRGRAIAFDIIVTDARGRLVWRRLEGETIPAIVQLRRLRAGERLVLTADWDQRDSSGARVKPGDYEAHGVLLTDGPEPLQTAAVAVRVETE